MVCPTKNHWCVPDHMTGTHSCICKHDYEGQHCKKKRDSKTILLIIVKIDSKHEEIQ